MSKLYVLYIAFALMTPIASQAKLHEECQAIKTQIKELCNGLKGKEKRTCKKEKRQEKKNLKKDFRACKKKHRGSKGSARRIKKCEKYVKDIDNSLTGQEYKFELGGVLISGSEGDSDKVCSALKDKRGLRAIKKLRACAKRVAKKNKKISDKSKHIQIIDVFSSGKCDKRKLKAAGGSRGEKKCLRKQKKMPFLKWSKEENKCVFKEVKSFARGSATDSKKCVRMWKKYARRTKKGKRISPKFMRRFQKNNCVKIEFVD